MEKETKTIKAYVVYDKTNFALEKQIINAIKRNNVDIIGFGETMNLKNIIFSSDDRIKMLYMQNSIQFLGLEYKEIE